jgi:hypothetical protein
MSNLKSANYYEQAGDKLKGRPALSAYTHAQNDAMNPPVTPEGVATWRRLQAKITSALETMEAADARKGCGTSEKKKASSRANGKLGGRPPRNPQP